MVLTLAAVLRRKGHEVMAWSNGPAALAAAAGFHPDVAVIDIGLPDMDGWELARRLRESCGPGLALVVAVTGYGDAEAAAVGRGGDRPPPHQAGGPRGPVAAVGGGAGPAGRPS